MPLNWLKKGSKKRRAGSSSPTKNVASPGSTSSALSVDLKHNGAAATGAAASNAAGSSLSAAPVAAQLTEAWRVENLREGGPPAEADWWVDDQQDEKDTKLPANELGGDGKTGAAAAEPSEMDVSMAVSEAEGDDHDNMSLDSQSFYAKGTGASGLAAAACCAAGLAVAGDEEEEEGLRAGENGKFGEIAAQASSKGEEKGSEDNSSDDDSSEESLHEKKGKKKVFCNRGYEIWVQSREAWTTYSDDDEEEKDAGAKVDNNDERKRGSARQSIGRGETSSMNSKSFSGSESESRAALEEDEDDDDDEDGRYTLRALEGLSSSQAEAMMRGLTRVTRTYQLPRRVALPDMVELLNDIWECERDY